jgi:hypothetical protein
VVQSKVIEKKKRVPKKDMKNIVWKVLDFKDIEGSIWEKVYKKDRLDEKLDLDEDKLESLF